MKKQIPFPICRISQGKPASVSKESTGGKGETSNSLYHKAYITKISQKEV